MNNWSVYILECSDNSLYTGISNNVEGRVLAHNNKKGAAALRGKLPVSLVYQEFIGSRSNALKREYLIKSLTRKEKLKLVSADL